MLRSLLFTVATIGLLQPAFAGKGKITIEADLDYPKQGQVQPTERIQLSERRLDSYPYKPFEHRPGEWESVSMGTISVRPQYDPKNHRFVIEGLTALELIKQKLRGTIRNAEVIRGKTVEEDEIRIPFQTYYTPYTYDQYNLYTSGEVGPRYRHIFTVTMPRIGTDKDMVIRAELQEIIYFEPHGKYGAWQAAIGETLYSRILP